MIEYSNNFNDSILSDTTRLSVYDEDCIAKLKKENEDQSRKIIWLNLKIDEMEKKQVQLPERYIINKDATILFWKNGEKTVVKRCAEDVFNPRLAFLTAFFQHYVDMSKNKANKYLANLQVEVAPEPKQKPKHIKEETKFNVGDIVEVTKSDKYSKKGWKGKIVYVTTNDVKVDYTNGQSWWILKDKIKLIKEENR